MDSKIIATLECADGNESVGTMWQETAIFKADTPICTVMDWADRRNRDKGWANDLNLNVRLSIAQEPTQ